MTTNAGEKQSVALSAKTVVLGARKAGLATIKPGNFVGIAAQSQPDGTLVALEVHVFAENLRGLGEGSYPWDSRPNGVMTNGNVGSAVGTSGRTLGHGRCDRELGDRRQARRDTADVMRSLPTANKRRGESYVVDGPQIA